MKGKILLLLVATSLLGCDNNNINSPPQHDNAVVSLQISPKTPTKGTLVTSIPKGMTQDFIAIAHMADKSAKEVTDSVAWQSSDTAIVTVNQTGFLQAVAQGEATLSATLNGVDSNTATITVTDAVLQSLQITPATVSLAKGLTQSLTATGVFSDDSSKNITDTVDWKSSDTAIVTVNQTGFLQAVTQGEATLSATLNGVDSNTATITVTDAVLQSLQITPATVSLAKGLTQSLTATGVFSDDSSKNITDTVDWKSSDTAIVTVNQTGFLQAVTQGEATLSATLNGVDSNTATITVTDAVLQSLQITPATVSLAKGLTQSLTATGVFSDKSLKNITDSVAWQSSDTAIVTVNQTGSLQAVAQGEVTLSATLNGVDSNTATITVTDAVLQSLQITPATVSLAKGLTQSLTATGVFSDDSSKNITDSVTWKSSDTAIVTVVSGLIDAVNLGQSDVTAVLDGINSNTATVTVTDSELMRISITDANGNNAVKLPLGLTTTLKTMGHYSDDTMQPLNNALWRSSTDAINVTTAGVVHSLKLGDANVIATFNNVSSNIKVEVTDALPTGYSSQLHTRTRNGLIVGESPVFVVDAKFTDGVTRNASGLGVWSSSDTSVATVAYTEGDNRYGGAVIHALKGGTAIIKLTIGDVAFDTEIKVSDRWIVDYTVTNISMIVGEQHNLTLNGIWNDGVIEDVSPHFNWYVSSGRGIVDVYDSAVVTALKAGRAGVRPTVKSGTVTYRGPAASFEKNLYITVTN